MASNHPVTFQSTIEESSLSYDNLIGYGGGGEVYHATWTSESLGKIPVAAKKIPIIKGSRSNAELGNEVAFLQQLDHPNIIKYYGHVVTKDHLVIVMEYAAKGSLYEYLRSKKSLSLELKSKWAIQGARGIKYLQENQVLHRDIKSSNFLITADDNLKICDFGISKKLTSTKTTTSEKGTVGWLAPEAFTELQLSPTADIFAFGIVLWELQTCQEPYSDMSSMAVMYKVGSEGLRPEIPATCSPVLRDLMQRCWDGDRTKRPSINEVIRQLQRCQNGDKTKAAKENESKQQLQRYQDGDRTTPPKENESKRQSVPLESGLHWRYKHNIDISPVWIHACNWISETHLAVCMEGRVQVYEVNAATSHLSYTLTSTEWKGVRGAVVSEALPGNILVICEYQPYVYQYPALEASREIKKYKIQSKDSNDPWCMAANASVVIINMDGGLNSFIVCLLSDFTHQYHVETSFHPYDLTISTHYLLVMGEHEMEVKSVGDLNQTVCVIKPPDGWDFRSVSCRNNATEIYAACYHGVHGKYRVYKYTWNGSGKPSYVNAGCVVDDLRRSAWYKGLSVTSGGLMAVGRFYESNVLLYRLE